MNRGEMIDRVQHTLGLEEVLVNDETALVGDWLNEGIEDIVQRTRPSTRVINLTLTGGVPIHDMASTIIALLDLEIDGYFLERYSREDISYRQAMGQTGYCYEEPLLWVSPIPKEDKIIRAYGVFRPTPMTDDAHDPSQPQYGGLAPGLHPTVVTYALWKGGEYSQHEQSAGGEKWRIQYEGQDGTQGDIARIKRILAKRVTPQGAHRRDPTRNLGSMSDADVFLAGGGR